MSRHSNFTESFFDGFTLSGFLRRPERPGKATRMFASTHAVAGSWQTLTFEPSSNQKDGIGLGGNLHELPESALHAMIKMLKEEEENRRLLQGSPEKAAHGALR